MFFLNPEIQTQMAELFGFSQLSRGSRHKEQHSVRFPTARLTLDSVWSAGLYGNGRLAWPVRASLFIAVVKTEQWCKGAILIERRGSDKKPVVFQHLPADVDDGAVCKALRSFDLFPVEKTGIVDLGLDYIVHVECRHRH